MKIPAIQLSLLVLIGLTTLVGYQKVLGLKTTQNTWTLVAGGDVMLGRSVNTQSLKKNDFTWAFKNIAPLLNNATLSIVNLESPLISNCPTTDTGMLFCGSARHTQGLQFAGIDLINLANNHILNQGQNGLIETLSLLNQVQISPVGLEHVAVKEVAGQKVAFLGFEAINKIDNDTISQLIKAAKNVADLVVVSFHWGDEYQSKPNSKQILLAHLAIDSGADLILGHHPHWVQSEEVYLDKHVFYSLGNLIFDQMWSSETRSGLLVKFTFDGKNLLSIDRYPLTIYDYGQPRLN